MNAPIEKIDPRTKSVTITVPLQFPIKVKSELGSDVQVYQIELGRLKVKHLKILPNSFLDETMDMSPADMRLVVLAFTGLTGDVADEIDLVDAKNIISIGIDLLKK
jgi:hypothetical protein